MTDGDRPDLIALYQHCGHEMVFIKSRQWLATYYALLGDAALVLVRHELVPADGTMWTVGLVAAAAILLALTLKFLHQCQADRKENTTRMLACYPHFSQEFRAAAGPLNPDTSATKAIYLIVGGAFFLTFILLLSPPLTS